MLNLKVLPNPTAGACQISFRLPSAGVVSVEVMDMNTRVVRQLLTDRRSAGEYSVNWDGRDEFGKALPAGEYRAWLHTREGSTTGRLVLLNRD